MAAPDTTVNIAEKFAQFEDQWSPKIIGQINELDLKAVRIKGEFVWHTHHDTDELFLVHSGRMTIQLEGGHDVTVKAGEFFVVPKGVEHRPVANEECQILILEPAGVVNTGEIAASDFTAQDAWI